MVECVSVCQKPCHQRIGEFFESLQHNLISLCLHHKPVLWKNVLLHQIPEDQEQPQQEVLQWLGGLSSGQFSPNESVVRRVHELQNSHQTRH